MADDAEVAAVVVTTDTPAEAAIASDAADAVGAEIALCVCINEGPLGSGTETVPIAIPIAVAMDEPTVVDVADISRGDTLLLAKGELADNALVDVVGDGASASSMAASRQTLAVHAEALAAAGAEIDRAARFLSGPTPGKAGTEICLIGPKDGELAVRTTTAGGGCATGPKPSRDTCRPGDTLILRRDGVVGQALVITVVLQQRWGDMGHTEDLCGEELF